MAAPLIGAVPFMEDPVYSDDGEMSDCESDDSTQETSTPALVECTEEDRTKKLIQTGVNVNAAQS
jgi:hypothetical protein